MISTNIPPEKEEESFSYPLQMEWILPPKILYLFGTHH
jgi:hypothetical protein